MGGARRRVPTPEQAEGYRAAEAPPSRSFREAVVAPGLTVVAEVKHRSPSAGALAAALAPAERAAIYQQGGAGAISVLTEPDFFEGSLEDLKAVRASVDLPVLRKDFVLTREQVWESRAWGADALLLVVAALSDPELSVLLAVCEEAGLTALVEVHTAEEAKRAVAVGSQVVGVNNRDLATLEVDLETSLRLAPLLDGVARLSESGIATPADAALMAGAGYDGILVGESLMRAEDPAALVQALREAGA
ncbi:MAG: indole-3-glycerol phosphate synthase TrpC [Acidimicrobiia bacterium]